LLSGAGLVSSTLFHVWSSPQILKTRDPVAVAFGWCLKRGRQTEMGCWVPAFASALRPTTMRDVSHPCQAENTRYCGSNLGQSQDVEACGKRRGRTRPGPTRTRSSNRVAGYPSRKVVLSAEVQGSEARQRFSEEIVTSGQAGSWHHGCFFQGQDLAPPAACGRKNSLPAPPA
jgi:hypothetical protein